MFVIVKRNFCWFFLLSTFLAFNVEATEYNNSAEFNKNIKSYNQYRDKKIQESISKQIENIPSLKSLQGSAKIKERIFQSIKKGGDTTHRNTTSGNINSNANIPDRNIPLVLDLNNDNKQNIQKTNKQPKKIILSQKQNNNLYKKKLQNKRDRLNFNRYWKEAHRNNLASQLQIGKMLLTGSGVAANPAEGQKWVEKSAKGGYLLAQTELANMYYSRKFYKNAVYWYEQSALQNDGDSLFQLGEIYSKGVEGVPQNTSKSAEYFIKSANANFANAQMALFYRYSMGDGVVQDPVEAYKWGMIAVGNRMIQIQKNVENYGAALSREQRKEALKRYSDWRIANYKPTGRKTFINE